jgi:acetyltransferase-like isoleucine patch superfamily enzyme
MKFKDLIDKTARLNQVQIGENVRVGMCSNLYKCIIGDNTKIGPYVEIQEEAIIGRNVIIGSHSFICSLVKVEDEVFIGHGVMTINDLYPPSRRRTGKSKDWKHTIIEKGTVIGTGAVLNPVRIGRHSLIGAGAVVTRDVEPYSIVYGNPARFIRWNIKAEGYTHYSTSLTKRK